MFIYQCTLLRAGSLRLQALPWAAERILGRVLRFGATDERDAADFYWGYVRRMTGVELNREDYAVSATSEKVMPVDSAPHLMARPSDHLPFCPKGMWPASGKACTCGEEPKSLHLRT